MGVKGDIEEASKLWKRSSLFTRLFVVVSVIVSSSSIASLSESIFKWKGFILEGLEFYKNYLVDPFRSYAHQIGLDFTVKDTHALVILSFAYSGMIRWTLGMTWRSMQVRIEIVLLISFMFFTTVYGLPGQGEEILKLSLLLYISPLAIFTTNEIITRLLPVNSEYKKTASKMRLDALKAMYSWAILSAFLVLIFAAVNIGLDKPIQ